MARVMVCGATESPIDPITIAGFGRAKALAMRYNDSPQKASRPFDKARAGFVMSEGAGIVVLEDYEHAISRRAPIYAEILGYGLSADAYHVTSPNPDSSGGLKCMKSALAEGQIHPSQIGYVNCHATSTPAGDQIENGAVKKMFESHSKNLQISSFKGSIGHMLGAAGSAEFALSMVSCKRGIIPPSINIDNLDDDFDLNYVPNESQVWKWSHNERRYGIKNSFGFGGTNSSICFASIDQL
ncbi:3-oxoacyl-[acyl-carrier-protein] synthase, mitochondrial-like [Octopus sinensis]|uniref:beta-ketoacyl-[acyl-carrier-protein] synthase I n=1 Tax=Octopus sinensis TaxID=2607531 RepID=A0A7E6EIN7_9MOLL|nr:3-oxoacyl-[acyl-carrier-protein] synthase, mitochondrial-like [Octopus sinensis]